MIKTAIIPLMDSLTITGYMYQDEYFVGLEEVCDVLGISDILSSSDTSALKTNARELAKLQFSGIIHSFTVNGEKVRVVSINDFKSLILFGAVKGCENAQKIREEFILRGMISLNISLADLQELLE